MSAFGSLGASSTRRRQAREQNGKRAEHNEGFSSDDEETSTDITSFSMEKGVVRSNRGTERNEEH